MPGVDETHDDSDEDSYATVGTAFELLETPEDIQKAKKQKEKEQYVTDEQGRRRFHGAFTGGFSAGYFNTVGSKEGWTPASFTSSRIKKAEVAQQRPEDFMDAEDLGEHGIAPREVAAKEQFTEQRPGTKRPQPATAQPSVIPGEPPLQNLIVPVKSTVGAKLLSAMGWRAGQGVGPKEKRTSIKPGPKVYGCSLPGQDDVGADLQSVDESTGGEFLYAPKDVKSWEFEAKDNVHGLGYSGMQEQAVLSTQQTSKALYGMSGQAFGTGALEEEEDDDIFAEESVAAYHASIAQEGDVAMEMKFGWTGADVDSASWSLSCFVKAKETFVPAKRYPPPQIPRDFSLVHKFSSAADKELGKGTRPLSSHERANMMAATRDELPSVFALVSVADRDRLKRVSEMAQQVSKGQLLPLEAHQRSQQVADECSQKKQFEYPTISTLPPAGLASSKPLPAGLTGSKPLPAGLASSKPLPAGLASSKPLPAGLASSKPLPAGLIGSKPLPAGLLPAGSLLPPPPPLLGRPSSSGPKADAVAGISPEALKPFGSDTSKQMRYEAFLNGRIENGQNMTEWELQREREEFSRTARVHQPLTTSLTSKFTRAKEDQREEESEEEEEESDAVQAAKVNMFGVLTRETFEWHPHNTLCKRFNVPEPYPRSDLVGVVTDEDRRNIRNRERAFVRESARANESEGTGGVDQGGVVYRDTESGPQTINFQQAVEQTEEGGALQDNTADEAGDKESNRGDKESNHGDKESSQPAESKEEEQASPRPPMDLFKAIFAEESSDSDEATEQVAGEEGGGANSTNNLPSSTKTPAPQPPAPASAKTPAPQPPAPASAKTPAPQPPTLSNARKVNTNEGADTSGVPSRQGADTSGVPSRQGADTSAVPSRQGADTSGVPSRQGADTSAVPSRQGADTSGVPSRQGADTSGVPSISTKTWQNLSLIANRVAEIPLHTVAMVTASATGFQPQATNDIVLNKIASNVGLPEVRVVHSTNSYGPALPPASGHVSTTFPADAIPQEPHSNKHSDKKDKKSHHKHKHKTEHRERAKKEKHHRKQNHS